ncbi:MAG: hypothetical protein U1E23_09400 [Reyranellaceae bacterium]
MTTPATLKPGDQIRHAALGSGTVDAIAYDFLRRPTDAVVLVDVAGLRQRRRVAVRDLELEAAQ